MILASQFLAGKIAAFMAKAGHNIPGSAVYVIRLPGIFMDKLCEIQVVGISGEKIQPVINIGTGRHIYIGAAAYCDNALAADGILVKGMFRPGRMYREGPGIGPGLV